MHAARNWCRVRRQLNWLGSDVPALREAAEIYFRERGEIAVPWLRRALRGPIGQACGAAVLLARFGDAEGIGFVLSRSCEEEWILRCVRDGHPEGLRALRRLERAAVGGALHAALDSAAGERDPQVCLQHLVVALGALRVLVIFEETSPRDWYARALRFGPKSLRGLHGNSSGALARNLTAHVRAAALRGLLTEHLHHCLEGLIELLTEEDPAVGQTAILGLLRLGDRRALPSLQAIAFGKGHPLANQARTAVEVLAGAKSDSLVLLRAAAPEDTPAEELLRPAALAHADLDAQWTLIRPAG